MLTMEGLGGYWYWSELAKPQSVNQDGVINESCEEKPSAFQQTGRKQAQK